MDVVLEVCAWGAIFNRIINHITSIDRYKKKRKKDINKKYRKSSLELGQVERDKKRMEKLGRV